ncbi:hypothetical protein VP1G_09690 [Cytospora mali]|uniref:Uncharacterized protein n=1 Tax=Cytospora mali TaxID=578113 RepID=A0A194VEZ1_CYTMA|nr:hypothetical protein VP1G_09690 [Valsa mali var. pyri (nom. inval.)]
MSDAAVQQPSPTKRGRGRGRGASARGAASTRAGRKPVAGRRGRQKVYETSRAQAAHERQRDLKNAYATVAAAMKPALEELADRNLDLLKSKFDAHQEVDQYAEITGVLNQRLQARLSELDAKLKLSTECANNEWTAEQQYTKQSFRNRWDDLIEDYLDAQLRRLDVLEELQRNRDPVTKRDESWNYKPITTEEAAEQGIYRKIYKGVEVPYPWLHPELVLETNKSKAVRTPSKRKTADLFEGQPTPKRPASALDEKASASIPRHIGGLLSAVAPEEPNSQPPSPSPVDDNGELPYPQANEPAAGTRGRKRKHPPVRSPSLEGEESGGEEDETMPPVPNGASDPDAYGVRLINKRPRAGDMPNNRIMVPTLFQFDSHEIGFRDSTNDKSRGATKAKRRKFLGQPNSGSMFFDRTLWTYDATQYADGELDQETVQKHKLHPKHGLFLDSSVNESDPPRPYQSGWKPTVFVPPDGKLIHTSRSIRAAKAEDAYAKKTLQVMMSRFMEKRGMTEDDIHDPEAERLLRERDERQLELEREEDEAQDEEERQLGAHNMRLLLDATTTVESEEAQDAKTLQEAQNVSPILSRPSTMSRPYDAIRDVFGNSDLPPPAPSPQPRHEDAPAMNILADLAIHGAEELHNMPPSILKYEEAQHIPIQMPEPVRPKQLRDPQELVQGEDPLESHDYPDPQHPSAQMQLAMPEHFMGREQPYSVQPSSQPYQDRQVSQPPLAPPENFSYRGPGMPHEQQHMAQSMQAPQPFLGHQAPPPQAPPEAYAYRESEPPYENPQITRQAQLPPRLSDEHYIPVPNTDDALLDPQLFENGQPPPASQLQASQQAGQQQPPQHSGVLQQPQTSFFQTALNSPTTPTPQSSSHYPDYPEPPQASQYPGPPTASASRPGQALDDSPGRTPFSNPSGMETQPLPPLRPLHRGSGSGQLMLPTAPGHQIPQHIMMAQMDDAEHYPAPPPSQPYSDHPYPSNGYGPDQPMMSTEQGPRPGYMAQPMMHSSQQQPPPYPVQQPYPPVAPMGSQLPPHYENAPSGPPNQNLQSPPPYANAHSGVPPSPGRRSGSISSSRNNNKQYREIKPAPRQAESWDNNGSELRTLMYNPYEGIRDYSATAPPPSHGPTQIRGWTHTTGSRKSRGKNSTDSHIDPSLAREEKK